MPQYTTGELAAKCGVSVRTVQFYDRKNLLKPFQLTEGGRRLYCEKDLERLRLIGLLKSLGLSLESIRGILESSNPEKVLPLLLEEQERQLRGDLLKMQQQLELIRAVRENFRRSEPIPLKSVDGMQQLMKSRNKLKKAHMMMLTIGIGMDMIQLGTVLFWIMTGNWLPFAACLPFVLLAGILMTGMYVKNTAYVCPECGARFKPSLKAYLFSRHTPRTRKLTCTHCGHKGYCVEVAAEKNDR